MVVHEYFKLIPEIILDIIHQEIPNLEKNILDIIKKREDKVRILQALEDTIQVLNKMNRHESVDYLKKIKALII